MNDIKTKFITAIYSDLNGTVFGGRSSRGGHYRCSLLSLLKIQNATFSCYTSENEIKSLKNFFYTENNISEEKLVLKTFNLGDNKLKDLIAKWKNLEDTKKNDRCVEIQYMKFFWSFEESKNYENVFWIDAGLSHCGIIPDKYLTIKHDSDYKRYFESNLFDDIFLEKLLQISENKFFIIAKENQRNYWSGTVNEKHFNNYDNSKHIIGGLFGGKSVLWKNIVDLFLKYVYKVTEEDGRLYHEEDIMTLMYRNHEELFKTLDFDIWWHENNLTDGLPEDYLTINKSFYKILEEIRQ